MYFLLSTVIRKNDPVSTLCKLLPTIFFIAIPLDVYVYPGIGLALAGMPLVFAFFIRGVFMDHKTRYAWLAALSSILTFLHPVFFPFTFALLLLYILIQLPESTNRSALFSYYLKFLVFVGLFNMATLFPFLISRESVLGLAARVQLVQGDVVSMRSWAHFIRLIFTSRMIMGHQWSAPYFSLPLVVLLGFFMVAYCYISVYLMDSKEQRVRIFARWLIISALCVTFFSTGVAYPTSESIFLFFYRAIPGLLYNISYLLYVLSVLYSLMLGLSTYFIVTYIRSFSQKPHGIAGLLQKSLALITVGIVIIGVISYITPVYSGYGFRGSSNTKVPEDYFQLYDLLRNKDVNENHLLIYPPVNHFLYFSWQEAIDRSNKTIHSVDIVQKFSPVSVVGWQYTFNATEMIGSAFSYLNEGNMDQALEILGKYSIKYIFVHKDMKDLYPNYPSGSDDEAFLSQTITSLSSSPYLTLVKNSDSFMLFEIDESLVVPMVYAVTFSEFTDLDNIILNHQIIKGDAINRGEYDITIPANVEVLIVLNQAYSSDWKLRVPSGTQIHSEHILINEFVNGWRVKNLSTEVVGHISIQTTTWTYYWAALSVLSIVSTMFIYIFPLQRIKHYINNLSKLIQYDI